MDLMPHVATIKGATFISLDTVTEVKLTGGRSNPLQGRVKKVMKGANVMLFSNTNSNGYDNMVKRRLAAEGKNPDNFVLSPRAWGQRLPGMPVVEHNGKRYLEVIFLKPGHSTVLVDGVEADPSAIPGYPIPNKPEQGGLDDTVIVRTFAFDSIVGIRIDGKEITK